MWDIIHLEEKWFNADKVRHKVNLDRRTNDPLRVQAHYTKATGSSPRPTRKVMSAESLRVATYMQEHPDDAAEIRDELKFWNEVMDDQVPMTKERAEATLPFLTALECCPLFTNTSPIMLCPPGLDPLDVRSFLTAESSSHLHADQASDEHRPGQPANLGRPDLNPSFSLIGPTVSTFQFTRVPHPSLAAVAH
ncbi:hypothetical protein H257_16844 [Aphanomyces astaci]|uniref:Uncharacterized protein n=1 Tax=Aphanomyces astaci TaxID=112090 RepID=W4FIU2_APHAT|nr:hypothetical protein H257_16844 [Aphanomyces astaci]ETV66751.1 hypothetical protein H257_16844 [Aphanomyces astaci]|eukprot:XP_009843727.1 hypothetical protein H257_16844 [Aphanomyces astaci]